jgi:hypothetical protein
MSVQRFTLNSSELDDAGFGLDGISPAFNLDSSALDGIGVLDGTNFLTVATATTSLGGSTASATSQITNPVIASSELGAITSQASSLVIHEAIGGGSLGLLSAQAISSTANSDTATAALGGVQAQATSSITHNASAQSNLQGLQAQATTTINNETTATATLGGLAAQATAQTEGDNTATAQLGSLTAEAQSTITPVNKPASSGGRIFGRPTPLPIFKPAQLKPVAPELVIEPKPKPKPRKFATIKATASVAVPPASVYASGSISWIAELDDLEVLELI